MTAARTGPILFLHQFYNTNTKEAFISPHLFWSLIKGNVRDTITVWGVGVDSPGQTHTHWVTGTLFRHELLQQGWGSDSAPVQPGGPAQVSRSLGVSRSPQSEGVGPDEKSPGDPLHISAPMELHVWKDLYLPNKLHELRNFF